MIEGKACEELSVSMEIRCLYNDLIRYIETLRNSLPAFVSIEKISVTKDKSASPSKLYVRLYIKLYLLS